jgi:hypothetical protein
MRAQCVLLLFKIVHFVRMDTGKIVHLAEKDEKVKKGLHFICVRATI